MESKNIIGITANLTNLLGVIIISFSNKNGCRFSTPTNTPSLTPTFTSTTMNTLNFTPTFTPNETPTETLTETPTPTPTPTATFMVVCTLPLCAIGTSETYYFPGVYSRGCGNTCAIYTPKP